MKHSFSCLIYYFLDCANVRGTGNDLRLKTLKFKQYSFINDSRDITDVRGYMMQKRKQFPCLVYAVAYWTRYILNPDGLRLAEKVWFRGRKGNSTFKPEIDSMSPEHNLSVPGLIKVCVMRKYLDRISQANMQMWCVRQQIRCEIPNTPCDHSQRDTDTACILLLRRKNTTFHTAPLKWQRKFPFYHTFIGHVLTGKKYINFGSFPTIQPRSLML